jgi:hypothetical protein
MAMKVTREQLRERGFERSFEEIEGEARELAARTILAMPRGRLGAEPTREFTPGEADALRRGGVDLSPPERDEPDPLARTAARYAAMLATSYTTSEVARMLGKTEGRIRQRVAGKSLYGLPTAGRGHRLPAFQFEGGGEVPNIGKVTRVLPEDLHPVEVLNWFTLPHDDLYLDEEEEHPVSPKEWLLSGGNPEVLIPLAEDL